MKKTKTKQIDLEQQKLRLLYPIINYAKDHHGFVSELTRRLTKLCPNRPLATAHVGAWLRHDESQRVQPRLGIGLILIEEGTKLMNEWGAAGRPKKGDDGEAEVD